MPEDSLLYWLVSGRIPYDDDDTLYATPAACAKADAEEHFRSFIIDDALQSFGGEEILRRARLDNIKPDQPLTEGVIVTGFASSSAPITVDGYLL